MSDIDQLSIQINADATKAEKAIDGLITQLHSLDNALKLSNVGNFKRDLESIKQAASGMGELSQSIKSLSTAGKNISDIKDFKAITDGLKELSTITIPSFSGLDSLTDSIGRLSRMNPNKIADIVNALQGIKNVKIENMDSLGKTASDVAEVSNGAKEAAPAMREMSQSAEVASNAVGLLVDRMHGFNQFASSMESIADVFDRMARSTVMEMLSQMGRELTQIASIPALPQLEHDIIDVTDSLVEMSSNAEAISETFSSFDNEHFGEVGTTALAIRDDFEEVCKAAYELQETLGHHLLSQVKDADVLPVNIGEVKEMQAGIEKFADTFAKAKDYNVEPLANSLNDVAENADKAEKKMSALDKYVERIVSHKDFKMDFGDQSLSNVLHNIHDFTGALSRMQQRPEIFNTKYFEEFTRELDVNKRKWEDFVRETQRKTRLGGGLDSASQEAQRLRDRLEDITRILREMDHGTIGMNADEYQKLSKEAEECSKRLDELLGKKKELEKPSNIDFLANIIAFAHELHNITRTLGNIGDELFNGLKIAFKPLDWLIEEHKERIKSLADVFGGMVDKIKGHLNKLSAFWKRVMKTFTFMLVRKAITAIIGEISDAIKSLALWSKQFGTIFNDSMSQITSNFSYIARGLVGMAEPLLNALVPAFNALADSITNLTAKIGEFFAALTGQGYYMVAKRQVTDYAESVEKAQKAQKNLIAGLDDLNIITTPTSTASGMDDVAEQWEKVDVSDKMKDFVGEVKDLAEKLFQPIKDAWDEAGDYVKDGFKYMIDELGKLAKDIGRDFMIVWQQPETTAIFEDLFHTIAFIEKAIGHLAENFRKAWNEGDKGVHILENLRDNVRIITDGIRQMAETFEKWAKDIDFNPLLKAFENFTKEVQPLTRFLMNVMNDIWERVILKFWEFKIEEGIPHLLNKISEVIGKFDFDKIREDLHPLEDAFERLLENIDIGLTNAFGNLGTALAEFTNSSEFTKFCETVAWLMDQVTAERVEKLFTALGLAIGKVAGNLVSFVNSDKFRDFIQLLMDWYDSKSAEEIADILVKVANAIALFKFTAFVGQGLAGFLEFITLITSIRGIKGTLGGISESLSGIAAGASSVGETEIATGIMGKIAGALKSVGGAILKGGFVVAIATGVALLIGHWGEIEPILAEIADKLMYGLGALIGGLGKFIAGAFIDAFKSIGDYFGKEIEECGGNIIFGILKGIGDALISIPVWIADHIFKPFIDGICSVFGIHSPAESMFPIGQFIVLGLFEGMKLVMSGVGALVKTFIFSPLMSVFSGAGSWLVGAGSSIVHGLISGIASVGSGLASAIGGLVSAFAPFMIPYGLVIAGVGLGVYEIIKHWDDICDAASKVADWIGGCWDTLVDWTQDAWNGITSFLGDCWDGITDGVTTAWNGITGFIGDAWDAISTTVTDVATSIGDFLSDAWNGMKEVASNVWETTKGVIGTVWDGIKTNVVKAADYIGGFLQGAWNGMKTVAETVWGGIQGAIETAWSGITTACDWAVRNLGGLLEGAWNGIKNAAEQAWSGITSFAASAWSKVKELANDAWNLAKSIGSAVVDGAKWIGEKAMDIGTGFVNGVKALGGYVADGASWLGNKFSDAFCSVMGIHSPSKVFENFGEMIVLGLNEGIDENADSTEKSINSWLNDITDFTIPQFDIANAIPKDRLQMDAYTHSDITGTAVVDNTGIQQSVRQGVMDAIGGLILPYLSDIAESSRETASKELTISDKAIGTAASRYAKDFQTRTGRPAFGY